MLTLLALLAAGAAVFALKPRPVPVRVPARRRYGR
jgi:hypothetical protein